MSRRYDKRRLPSAEDVLRDRAAATMEQLFELIHLVNPTGMQMTERERAERYATKGRLQSLLLEQHLDALEVQADPSAGEGIVTIRHRQNRRDACHARLLDLTPMARFQVQLQWDLAGNEADRPRPAPQPARQQAPAGEPAAPEGSADELLRRGAEALAEFDFDQARTDFTAALQAAILAASHATAVQSACRLLELLVDQLAETGEALGWKPRLPQPALADPAVRCLLALAAVREGQVELAAQMVAGIESGRADEVHVELARTALDAGTLDLCEGHLAHVAPAGEQGDAARAVLALLQQKRVEAAAPLEQRLPRLLAEDQREAAQALAREILALHPGSESARRTLRELAQREQEQRLAAQAVAVENALASGSGEHAARLLQAEPGLAGSLPDLEQRVREACAREELRRRQILCDQLSSAIGEGATAAGVEAFWAADEATRALVRDRVHSRELFWIDELGPFAGRTPVRTAAAVAALVRLEQTPDPAGLAELLDQLPAQESLLRRSAAAHRLLQETRSRLEGQRRAAAQEQLAAVEAATGSDLSTARASLAAVDERALAARDRERLAAVRARIEAAEAVAAWLARFEHCLQAGDLLGARSAAAALAAQADAIETAAWRTRVEELTERIKTTWIRQTIDGATIAENLGDVSLSLIHSSPQVWLLPGGRHLVLVSKHGQWLFVRLLDLDDDEQSRAVVIRTPEPLAYCRWQVDGETVWITDELGHVLQVGLRPWDILTWKCLREVRGLPDPIGDCALLDSRHLWARSDRPFGGGRDEHSHVVDVESWRIERRIECFFAHPIQGAMPPRVAIETDAGRIFLTDARGASVWRAEEGDERLEGAAVHPTGRGVLLVTGSSDEVDDYGSRVPFVVREAEHPGPPSNLRFDDSDADLVHIVATSLEHGLTFLCYAHDHGPGQQGSLVVIEALDSGLAVRNCAPVDSIPFLVQDPKSDRVVALHADGSRVQAVALGPDGLGAASGPVRSRLALAPTESLCRWRPDDLDDDLLRLSSSLLSADNDSLDQAIRDQLQARSSSGELVALLLACPPRASQATRDLVVGRLAAHCERGDPLAALGLTEHAARSGQWAKVLERLAAIEIPGLAPAMQQHVHHLRGLGRLMLGDEASAREPFLLASACASGTCMLSEWPELVSALTEPLEPAARSGGTSPVRALVLAIRTADRALEGRDFGAAIAALDDRAAWPIDDAQVLARLAQAWLGVESGDPVQRFRKRLALAAYAARDRDDGVGYRLQLGSIMWPPLRMEEIAQRAREWLET